MIKKRLILSMLVFVFLLAACSGTPAPVEYTIELSEFAFAPNELELKVGQEVTLNLVNNGALAHEFMVGREAVKNADGQFVNFEHDFFHDVEPVVSKEGDDHGHEDEADDHHDDEEAGEDHGHEGDDHGFMVSLPGNEPNSVTTITFTVTEDMVGEWEMGCFLDGGSHFISGMTGTVVVTP